MYNVKYNKNRGNVIIVQSYERRKYMVYNFDANNRYYGIYKAKLRTPEEIAEYIEDDFVCACPTCMGEHKTIVHAIGERARRDEITNVQHHSLLSPGGGDYLDPELAGKYYHVSWFTTAASRAGVQEGRFDYMPAHYSQIPYLWREKVARLDVFYATVSPMDKHGFFSFGLVAAETLAQLERAKYIFLEVNDQVPRVMGTHVVHISQVTALCEASYPMPTLEELPLSENSKRMGAMIAELIPDGATIQFGIGEVPNAVGKLLLEKKDLGIHTEMFTDSMVDLIEAGAVTNMKKNIDVGKTVAAFCWGSQRMYDFLDDNRSIELHGVDYVNDPYVIGKLDNFVSINAGLEIDFLGQVCSESIGWKPYSGTGGQLDFVRGSAVSKGGKSFIAMNSTAKGGTISKIKPILTPGAAVTTTKNDIDNVVTEYGIARLKGKTAGQRAKALIEIAHPKFRDELTFEAKKMNLMI